MREECLGTTNKPILQKANKHINTKFHFSGNQRNGKNEESIFISSLRVCFVF